VVPHAVHVPPEQNSPPVAQALPFATHALPTGSQHEPAVVQGVAPAQHVPPLVPHDVHVPAAHTWPAVLQAVLAVTQSLFAGSQHAPAPAFGQALPPGQHWLPLEPQVTHDPAAHTWPAVLQFVLAATHLLFAESQHAPAPVVAQGVAVGQQRLPLPPHAVHVPAEHTWPVVLQLVLLATHVLFAGSQHAPAEAHAGPVVQQVVPVVPQVAHVPLVQVFPLEHASPGPTHALVEGSQQAPAVVHAVAPAQQTLPVAPHDRHDPPEQTMSVPPHAVAGATHRLSLGSQHAPAALHRPAPPSAPGQQKLVLPPHDVQKPPLHTVLVPWHARPVSTQRWFALSQHPPLLHAPPAQHGSPGLPHVSPPSASAGLSAGLSAGESAAVSAPPLEESTGPSPDDDPS
jgi:hypothetical protein